MKETRVVMGMPVTVCIADRVFSLPLKESVEKVFSYFTYIDDTFSTYKDTSEIAKINNGLLSREKQSDDMKMVLDLCEETKKATQGYFDIQKQDGSIDPSGLVKGWAIYNASDILKKDGLSHFYIEAGGDIQTSGRNEKGELWKVGIKNPFSGSPSHNKEIKNDTIVKVVTGENIALATSGTYIRGQHIYNPKDRQTPLTDIVSFTVIGPTVYEADRFATAAFAMGREGIMFIENLKGFEGYIIDTAGTATSTSGFAAYVE